MAALAYRFLDEDSGCASDEFREMPRRSGRNRRGSHGGRLALLGAEFRGGKPGFYLLDSPAGIHGATSEYVLDRDCKVLQSPESQTAH